MVSPLESFIRFKTVFYISPKETNPDTKWFQIQNNSSKEIPCYKRKRIGNEITEYLKIPNTEENHVAYQFCVENKRSNKMNVIAEGMFLRRPINAKLKRPTYLYGYLWNKDYTPNSCGNSYLHSKRPTAEQIKYNNGRESWVISLNTIAINQFNENKILLRSFHGDFAKKILWLSLHGQVRIYIYRSLETLTML